MWQRLLWRLFGDKLVFSKELDRNSISGWLQDCMGKGFSGYYTIRKKAIYSQMGLGLKEKDYWKMVGRIEELKELTRNVTKERKRQDKKFKKVK